MYEAINIRQIQRGGRFMRPPQKDRIVFQPRTGVPPLDIELPFDWAIDPFVDRNWCAQLHMLRLLDQHLGQYDETNDPEWLDLPIRIVRDWHEYHVVRGRQGLYSWSDMVTGMRAMRFAYLLSAHRAHDGWLGKDDVAMLNELGVIHADRIMHRNAVRYNNHTFADIHGLGALRSQMPEVNRTEISAFIGEALPELLRRQFTDDGVHSENSPGYQSFASASLRSLIRSGWFEDYGLGDLRDKANAALDMFHMPDGRIVPIGDTDGLPMDEEAGVRDALPGLIDKSGYVIRRDRTESSGKCGSYFLFMGAYNSLYHKHDDDMSYIWFDDEDIVCDAGKYAYRNDAVNRYFSSTRAHNTVEIDGQTYNRYFHVSAGNTQDDVYGSAVEHVWQEGANLVISAKVEHRRLNALHRRVLVFRPSSFVLAVDFIEDLTPQKARPIVQWTHFAPHIALQKSDASGFQGELLNGRKLAFACDARRCDSDDAPSSRLGGLVNRAQNLFRRDTELVLVRGQLKPQVQGWISQAYGEITPNDAAGVKLRHTGRSMIASIVQAGDGPCAVSIGDQGDVRFVAGRGEGTLLCDGDGSRPVLEWQDAVTVP